MDASRRPGGDYLSVAPRDVRPAAALLAAAAVLAVGLGSLAMLGAGAARAAAVRFVDDNPGCSGHQPCYQTIQAAVNAAADGDEIQVAPGRYVETVVLVDRSLVFEGPGAGDPTGPTRPDRHAVWIGQSGGARGAALTVDAATKNVVGVRVSGFRIVSASVGVQLLGRRSGDPAGLPPGRPPSGLDTTVTGAQVVDNMFADVGGGAHDRRGAVVAYWSAETHCENNVIVGGDAGIRLIGGDGSVLRGNRILGPVGPGVSAEVAGDRLEIAGNSVAAASGRGIQVRSLTAPGLSGHGRQIVLADNVITGTVGEGILVAAESGGGLSDVRLTGNRVSGAAVGSAGNPTPLGAIALRGDGGQLTAVQLVGDEVRSTRRPVDSPGAGIYFRRVIGPLAITDTVVADGAGPGILLVDVAALQLHRATITGNAEGVRIVETLPASTAIADGAAAPVGQLVLGGAPGVGNDLGGNVGRALVLANEKGNSISTADVLATYNDWGTAYGPGIERQIQHRPDSLDLGLVDYLPALGVPDSVTLVAQPPQLVADGLSESEIRATVSDSAGRPAAADTLLLWAANGGTLSHSGRLAEAEQAEVTQSGEWGIFKSEVFGPNSGEGYIRSRQVGAELVWRFAAPALLVRYGQALQVTGVFRVVVDGIPLETVSTLGPEKRWVEQLVARDLGPGSHTVAIQLVTGELNVDLFAAGETIATGQALARLRADVDVGSGRVTAVARGADGARQGAVEVPFTTGPPTAIGLSFAAPNLAVGGLTTTVTADVRDARNRPVADGTRVSFTTTRGFIEPATASVGAGNARATLRSGLEVGTAAVSAAVGTLTVTETIAFIAGPPATLEIEAQRPTIPADSRSATELVVRLFDEWQHPVPDGTTVTLTTTLGALELERPRTVGGIARTSLRSGAEAGMALVQATAGGVSGGVAVSFTALDLSLQKTVEPQSVVVPGEEVTFTLAYANRGANTVYDVEIEDPIPTGLVSPTLLAAGPRLEQLRDRSALAWRVARLRAGEHGTITITLRVDTDRRWVGRTDITNEAWARSPLAAELTPADNASLAQFVVVPAATYTVTVQAPERLLVGGATGAVTAFVTDRYGNPAIDGTLVFWSTDLGTVEPGVTTARNGVVSATFTTGTRAGVATVRALSLEERGGFARVRVMPGPATNLSLASGRKWLPVGGASAVITAALTDHFDNLISSAPVRFETNLGILSETAGLTGAAGVVTTSLRTGVRTGTAAVQAHGAFLSSAITIPFRAGPVALIDLALDRARVRIGDRLGARVRVTDEFENPVAREPVTFTSTIGLVQPGALSTDESGVATTSITAFRRGRGQVSVTAGGRTAVRELVVEAARVFLPSLPHR